MSKIGINISVDVTKILKERLIWGKKGTYLDISGFIDLNNQDQYGYNGFVSQSVSKEEREQGVQTPILGNTKVFYNDSTPPQQAHPNRGQSSSQYVQNGQPLTPEQVKQQSQDLQAPVDDFDDNIPF